MQTTEIYKYFKPYPKLDIYHSDSMKSNLQVEWKELSYEDLKLMEETIEKDINNSNIINSLLGTALSILIALMIGYIAISIGIDVNDKKIDKATLLIPATILVSTLTLLITYSYVRYIQLNKRKIRLQTIVRVLIDLKKSEQNF